MPSVQMFILSKLCTTKKKHYQMISSMRYNKNQQQLPFYKKKTCINSELFSLTFFDNLRHVFCIKLQKPYGEIQQFHLPESTQQSMQFIKIIALFNLRLLRKYQMIDLGQGNCSKFRINSQQVLMIGVNMTLTQSKKLMKWLVDFILY